MEFEELRENIAKDILTCKNVSEIVHELEGKKLGILISRVDFKELVKIHRLNEQK